MEKLAAFNTMIAIKKKMHNMKQDKENAFDKADQLEQKLIEHKSISEKVEIASQRAILKGSLTCIVKEICQSYHRFIIYITQSPYSTDIRRVL
jgi:hypothetical protein